VSGIEARARAAGLVTGYRDGAGRWQQAPEASIEAVLAALATDDWSGASSRAVEAGQPVAVPAGPWELELEGGEVMPGTGPLPPLPPGYHRITQAGRLTHLLAAPRRLPPPPRAWGLTVPLFALWDRARDGMGRYPMLGDLAEGLAARGAAFLGINPVHAGFPDDASNFSPYAPSHRRRLNILHVDTGAALPETGPLIDHAPVITAQMAALERAFAGFRGDPAFDRWCADQGESLHQFVTHQALAERHGPYWNRWPPGMQSPESPAVREFAQRHSQRLQFFAWAQWMAECQLSDSAIRARSAGMPIGLYLDLAVGTHPFGAETWAERGLFAQGVSLGAPPDLLGPSGQRWGLAPMRPDVLMATGFRALRDTLRAQLRHAGMLRIDHILGFERSFWLPDGLPGLYVQMPREQMLAVIRIEAARAHGGAGAVIVGEDLGTIPDGLRAALTDSGILGCRLAVFERDWDGDGAFVPPDRWEPAALAAWASHDTPTWAGWRAGRDLDWRERLGELPDPGAARATRSSEIRAFDTVAGPSLDDLHRHLAGSACALVAVQAEDLAGAIEQANLPGTVHEHPNWRRRLPLSVAELAGGDTLHRTAALMAQAGRNPQELP